MLFTFKVVTGEKFQVIDVTKSVQEVVWKSGVTHGMAIVLTPHTTTGLMINEYEPGLIEDIKAKMKELVPEGAGYAHDRIDSNAHSHIRASIFLNPEVIVPVDQGELQLGTWQRILLVELDGPRHRRVQVMVCPCPVYPEEE